MTDLVKATVAEMEGIGPIQGQTDYEHFLLQLQEMRQHSKDWHGEQAFAMLLAVLFRVNEYEDLNGMALSEMPEIELGPIGLP